MKYTKENLIGIGITSENYEESKKIIKKLRKLGIDRGWTGNSGLCYYGIDKDGFSTCCSNYYGEFPKTITLEQFMNDDFKSEFNVIDNFKIY